MTCRRIAVFTGNRAEYGLQYPILRAIAEDPRLEYFLLVSGAHLKEDFGRTLREIEEDGFAVHAQVSLEMPEDSLFATAQAIGTGILSISEALAELSPDALVVYADRFESFAAMIAGTQMGIPTAHIEGGDYTEGGALDDTVRHAMTKLAHLHFTTNERAAERVRRMGEEPWRVFTVGLPALDLVARGEFSSADEIRRTYELDPDRPTLVFTQHSVSTECDQSASQVRPSLEALLAAEERWGCQSIVTYPNDDAGGRRIMAEIEAIAREAPGKLKIHRSLGRRNYLGVLAVAKACLGNSSSGIKETPAFHCPCINIGSRQRGRLRADNVIDVGYDKSAILSAIERCLEDNAFQEVVRTAENPYGAGDAGPRIAEILATIGLDRRLIQKRMVY